MVLKAALFVLLLGDAVRTGAASTWIALLAAVAGSVIFEALHRRRDPGRTDAASPVRPS